MCIKRATIVDSRVAFACNDIDERLIVMPMQTRLLARRQPTDGHADGHAR